MDQKSPEIKTSPLTQTRWDLCQSGNRSCSQLRNCKICLPTSKYCSRSHSFCKHVYKSQKLIFHIHCFNKVPKRHSFPNFLLALRYQATMVVFAIAVSTIWIQKKWQISCKTQNAQRTTYSNILILLTTEKYTAKGTESTNQGKISRYKEKKK